MKDFMVNKEQVITDSIPESSEPSPVTERVPHSTFLPPINLSSILLNLLIQYCSCGSVQSPGNFRGICGCLDIEYGFVKLQSDKNVSIRSAGTVPNLAPDLDSFIHSDCTVPFG